MSDPAASAVRDRKGTHVLGEGTTLITEQCSKNRTTDDRWDGVDRPEK